MDLTKLYDVIIALTNGDNALLFFGAIACAVLTALVKKCCLDKTRIDLTHSFDPTPLLPFLFAFMLAGTASLFLGQKGGRFDFIVRNSLCIGSLAVSLYKVYTHYFGSGNLKALLNNDDVFNLLYTQLLYLTDAKKRLVDGTLNIRDFVGEIQTLKTNLDVIYLDESQSSDAEDKLNRLETLLKGIVDEQTIATVAPSLNSGLIALYDGAKTTK